MKWKMFLFFEGGNILVRYLKVQTKGMELEPIKGKPDKVSMRFQDSFGVHSGSFPWREATVLTALLHEHVPASNTTIKQRFLPFVVWLNGTISF